MAEFQKILDEMLQDGIFKYPFTSKENGKTYNENLSNKLDEYVKRIDQLKTEGSLTKWLKSNIKDIKKINQYLMNALEEYLTGSAGKAYAEIEKMMELQIVNNGIIQLKSPLDRYKENSTNKSLFRVRISDSNLQNKAEIFHIPFQKRYLVGSQRYSIAGVPCLYLGTSLYVCWEEMGRPDLNHLYLSSFRLNPSNGGLQVLNFAYSLETLKHINLEKLFDPDENIPDEKLRAYLVLWPVLMACSFNKQINNANFTVEYVIPNLILQWISKEKRPVSGIMYFSTKTMKLRNNEVGINFVFPPSTDFLKPNGFCVSA